MPTRAEVFNFLSQYAGANNDFNQRLDLVRQELIRRGNWRGTKKPVVLSVFQDVDTRFIVTLPRGLNTILAGRVNPPTTTGPFCWMANIRVRNGWYEFVPGWSNTGWPGLSQLGFDEANGRFSVFQDWSAAVPTPLSVQSMKLRFRFAVSETANQILVRGTSNGAQVFTGSPPINGEQVTFSGLGPNDTVTLFDARDLLVVKPATQGTVSMFTVDSSNNETLVAIYQPDETVVRWRRYFVSNVTNPTSNQYLALCKIAFIPLISDYDEVVPGDLGALRNGLEALKYADAKDKKREKEAWDDSVRCLIEEREDDEGAGATGSAQIEDTFCLAELNEGYGWYGGW